jgi:hypothetical protein
MQRPKPTIGASFQEAEAAEKDTSKPMYVRSTEAGALKIHGPIFTVPKQACHSALTFLLRIRTEVVGLVGVADVGI